MDTTKDMRDMVGGRQMEDIVCADCGEPMGLDFDMERTVCDECAEEQ